MGHRFFAAGFRPQRREDQTWSRNLTDPTTETNFFIKGMC